jgi:hypothetical protein
MFNLKPSDRDLLSHIAVSAVTVAIMLGLIYLLGEVHGLIATVVILIVHSSLLNMRITALQRELCAVHDGQPPGTTRPEAAAP